MNLLAVRAASCCTRRRCRAAGSGAEAYALRRLARGGGPVAGGRSCRSGRPTTRDSPYQRRVGVRRLDGAPRRARRAGRRATELERFVARASVLDRRLGARSPARARSPTRCASSASGTRCARTRPSAASRLIGDLPIYVADGGADHVAWPGALPATASSPACRPTPSAPTASSGATRSTTGRRCARRATAGGSSASAARSSSST